MGPCVSDSGCSQGSRASLTDAAVWLAVPGAHAARINHLALALALRIRPPPGQTQKTRREDTGVQTEGGKKDAHVRLVVCYQEVGVGSGRDEDALCECVFTRERCWGDALWQEANAYRCLPFFIVLSQPSVPLSNSK